MYFTDIDCFFEGFRIPTITLIPIVTLEGEFRKQRIGRDFIPSRLTNFVGKIRWQRNSYLIVANKNSDGKSSWFCLIRNNNKPKWHDSSLMFYFFLQVIIVIKNNYYQAFQTIHLTTKVLSLYQYPLLTNIQPSGMR